MSHSRLKRIHEQAQRDNDGTFQERSFMCNFYNFAKEAVAGTIGGGGDSPEAPSKQTRTAQTLKMSNLKLF
jgi:hypothetical protein